MVNHPPHDVARNHLTSLGIWTGECSFGRQVSTMLFSIDRPMKDSEIKQHITTYLEAQYEAKSIQFYKTPNGKVKATWRE